MASYTNTTDLFLFNSSGNSTEMTYSSEDVPPPDNGPYSPLITGLRTCFVVLTFLLIVAGNIFSLSVMRFVDSPRFPPSSKVFLSNVILSDLVYGIFSLFLIGPAALNFWPYGNFLCVASHVVDSWICACCVNAAVLITIDRLLAVLYPLRHATIIPRRRALAIVAVSTIFALVITLSMFTGAVQVSYNNAAMMCLIKWSIGTSPYLVRLIFFAAYSAVIPAAILIGCYTKLYLVARKHTNRRAKLRTRGTTCRKSSGGTGPVKGHRALKMCSLIAGTFCIAWTPYFVVSFRSYFLKTEAPPLVDFFINWFCFSNSWWDVIIYFLMAKEFRKTALKVAHKRWLKNNPNKQRTVMTQSRPSK
ncbi:beta-4C adrenergic receptor-like [Patiria miniata]|uniref:G-protein coupled receptors family 1 profile domain-containing protein n=1 Tax=Patiria miniata TaxID=46514 RepID=A0A914BMD7_PATMI|nr:beta-4C adrenergic receptor-like [Patiria miniata]